MKMCQLTVRTLEGEWTEDVNSWTSLVVLAALSAEPESFAELAEAVRRYQLAHRLFAQHQPIVNTEVNDWDGPWCLIDLAGRTVVAGRGFQLPDPRESYQADEDDHAEGFPIVWLDTPADWLFQNADTEWRKVVASRARARSARRPRDFRAVLFGPPLLEYLADNARVENPSDRDEAIRILHAQWLLTPRDDLGGRMPREVLLAERNRLSLDLDHRSQQWSMQGHAAPPLPIDSIAYRFAGFGTVEVVLYFDLMRALLDEAMELAKENPRLTRPRMIEKLASFRDAWLIMPNESSGPSMTPAQLIESERRRMPITSDGSHLDCDCPICQAQADGQFGPAFMCFDGHHLELEDDFAFSLCVTREEWDRQQDDYRKFAEEMERKEHERAAAENNADPLTNSTWQTSFVNWEGLADDKANPQMAFLGLGFPLAEIVSNLKDRAEGNDLLRAANAAYGHLRASQEVIARESAAQELRETLERVCDKFSDLTPKCADLQSRLDELLRKMK